MTGHKKEKHVFRLLIVEDDQTRVGTILSWLPDGVQYVNAPSAGTAIGILKRAEKDTYSAIMLDYDLDKRAITQMDRHLSGYNVIEMIINHVSPDVPILIHSMNSSGGARMMESLIRARFSVTRITMQELNKETFLEWLTEAYEAWDEEEE